MLLLIKKEIFCNLLESLIVSGKCIWVTMPICAVLYGPWDVIILLISFCKSETRKKEQRKRKKITSVLQRTRQPNKIENNEKTTRDRGQSAWVIISQTLIVQFASNQEVLKPSKL